MANSIHWTWTNSENVQKGNIFAKMCNFWTFRPYCPLQLSPMLFTMHTEEMDIPHCDLQEGWRQFIWVRKALRKF